MTKKQLRVFLCSGKEVQEHVRLLHRRLCADGIDCILDEEMPIGGQNWKVEIRKKIKNSDIVIICLLKKIIVKEGFIHEEIKLALDSDKEKPEGTIYLIPVKLEKCSVPVMMKEKQAVDLFTAKGYEKLINALSVRAVELKRIFPDHISKDPLFSLDGQIEISKQVTSKERKSLPGSFSSVMFVNRVDEIEAVTATAASGGQYFLVDAPAGYGKTWFLHKLDEYFAAKKNWLHAMVSVKKDCNLETLTKELAKKLGLELGSGQGSDWGFRLSGAIKKRYPRDTMPSGLVLLIDLDEDPSFLLARDILGKFIPQVWEILSDLDAFSRSATPSLFRIILSGRNITTEKSIKIYRDQLPFINKILSPFTYDVVYKSAKNHLPEIEKKKLEQLVAHLLFLTGGHPGCMSSALNLYKSGDIPIERFVTDTQQIIWDQIVRDVTEKVWTGLNYRDKKLQEAIHRLSVYRYVNNHVLCHVIENCPVKGMRDEIDLRDMLTGSYLYTNDGRFLQDGIIRQLVLIHLRQTMPKLYEGYCKDAYQVCKEQLTAPTVQLPEKWVVEMLHQYLLQHAGNGIEQPAFRSKISKQFNKEVVSIMQVRKKTKSSLSDWREEVDALLSEMDKGPQWEFRFSVNYFLRDGHYTDEPFQKLKVEIKKQLK